MKTIEITRARLGDIMRALREIGYSALDAEEKEICDAFDRGAVKIKREARHE